MGERFCEFNSRVVLARSWERNFVKILTFLAGRISELAGCRSTLSMSKIKVKISERKYSSFYKTFVTV